MERVKRHHYIDTIDQVLSDAVTRGLIHLTTEDETLSGRTIKLSGKDVINFGSCSYLGLELDPRLINGIIDAAQRFGSQYSSSRAYISSGQYLELESHLEQVFNNPVVVSPSTTLGHIGAIPVLVNDGDAILLDHQVHASVQTAVNLLKARGVPVSMIRHNDLNALLKEYKKLKSKYQRIWYMVDGVYSMYGDFAPLTELYQMMDENPQLSLYVDDAHGMSWTGQYGVGYALSQIQQHENMILAVSLNKAFACAGGAIILPNKEMARRVRTCASSLVFSGPIQPPMLGAAIASAEIHASGQIHPLQQELKEKILFANQQIKQAGLPLLAENYSPILFIGVGLPRITYNLVKRMMQEGFYVNTGTYPATPMSKGGIRFTLTRHLHKNDISELVQALKYHYPLALKEEGSSLDEVGKLFKLAAPTSDNSPVDSNIDVSLKVNYQTTIQNIDPDLWDQLLGENGSFNWQGMAFQETVFNREQAPEHSYQYHYLIVSDCNGQVILATFFSVALLKDDMFADMSVSEQIELKRKNDRYVFTSRAVMLGSMLSEGEHLYLLSDHPQWKEAFGLLLDKMRQIQKEVDATSIILRDFFQQQKELIKPYLLEQGLIEVAIPDNHKLTHLSWNSIDEYLSGLSSRARRHVRREMLDFESEFDIRYGKSVAEEIKACCYKLYHNVKTGNLAINCYGLPYRVTEFMFKDPNWDIIRIHVKNEANSWSELPVAVMFAFKAQQTYTPLLAGLNYDYLHSHKIYKQLLFQTVKRARMLDFKQINFGFTASQEKRQVGAIAIPSFVFVQTKDNFTAEFLETLAVT